MRTLSVCNTSSQYIRWYNNSCVVGARCCSTPGHNNQWMTSQYVQTADDRRTVAMTTRHSETLVDGVAVKSCDLPATNGIVHTIDQFLPSALRAHVTVTSSSSRSHPHIRLREDRLLTNLLAGMNRRFPSTVFEVIDEDFADDDDEDAFSK